MDRMYVKAPTGKSKEDLDALLFERVARRNRTDPLCVRLRLPFCPEAM